MTDANGDAIRSSPLVRRIARERNIDLAQVPGTGAGGRVSKQDILAAAEGGAGSAAAPAASAAPARTAAPPPAGGALASGAIETAVPRERMYFGHYEVQPMSNMRQKIAEHMVLSKRVSPHVYSVEEVNVSGICRPARQIERESSSRNPARSSRSCRFSSAPPSRRCALSPPSTHRLTARTSSCTRSATSASPSSLDWGLIVPVIKGAEEKNFFGLARAVTDLAERARSKKLKPDEVMESTFSITNPGVFGGLFGLPVINQPNVAILGLGTIEKRPVVIDDAIAIRSMVYLTLSYDHRAVDGAIAHQFMGHVKHTLENWTEPIL